MRFNQGVAYGYFYAVMGLVLGGMLLWWAWSTTSVTFAVARGAGEKGIVVVGDYVCTEGTKTQTCTQYGTFVAPGGKPVPGLTMFGFPNAVNKGQRLPAVYLADRDPSSVYAPNDRGDFAWTIIRYLMGLLVTVASLWALAHLTRNVIRRSRGKPPIPFLGHESKAAPQQGSSTGHAPDNAEPAPPADPRLGA